MQANNKNRKKISGVQSDYRSYLPKLGPPPSKPVPLPFLLSSIILKFLSLKCIITEDF